MIEATMPACPENKKSSSRGEHQGSHTAASSSTGPTGRQHPHQPAAAATAAEDDASRSPPPLGGNSLSRDEETLRDDAHCPTSVVGANTEPLSNKVDDDNEEENDGTNRNRDDIPSSNNNTNRADDDDDDDDADYDCENGASYDTIESELLPTTSDTQCNDDDDDEDDENAAAARVSLPAPSSNTNTPPMATSRQRRRLLKQQKRIYSLLDAAPSSDDKMQPPHHQQQHQPQQSCSSLNCDDTGFAAAAARRVPNNTDPQSGATTTLLGMTSLKVESPRTESHADPIQDNMDSKPDRTLDAEPRTPAATATTTTAKGELHRQTTEKKSNVSSPSAYSPGSLLDDDQSNCSERPLRQKISLAANASTSAAAATTGTRMPVLLPPLHSQANNNSSTGNTNIAAPRMRSAESDGIDFEEKKDHVETEQPSDTPERRAQVAQRKMPFDFDDASSIDHDLRDCLSATESEVASLDGLPSGIQQRWLMGESPRETMLQSLDGVHNAINWRSRNQSPTSTSNDAMLQSSPPRVVLGGGNRKGRNDRSKQEVEDGTCDGPLFASCFDFSMWTGGIIGEGGDSSGRPENGANNKGHWRTSSWKQQHDVPLAIMDCANIINQDDRCSQFAAQMDSRVQPSVVQVASDYPSPTYAETILPTEVDPRMQDWIASQYAIRDRPPKDGTYQLGRSRTVIVHEMFRGNWTWCTSWSPDGAYLAIATDNHHLAVVDTASSTVWRVCHDRKIREPPKNNSTNSIRSVAWGPNYIAIGGTGNAVSILSSTEPYNIIHTIPGTGFVGCLHWRCDSDVLAIGSRLDCVMIMRIQGAEDFPDTGEVQRIESYLLHKIPYKYWANSVAFSPDGCFLAVGDSGGIVSVYDYDESDGDAETNMITWFKRKDSILSIEWSPDGKWLYAGGEDRSVTVIDTTYWEIVHRIGQDRWVQCIASSHGGTHVAVGGVSSEISILDVENGWDSVMGIELKGLGKSKTCGMFHAIAKEKSIVRSTHLSSTLKQFHCPPSGTQETNI